MCYTYDLITFVGLFQITKTYGFLTPDLWREIPLSKTPYEEYSVPAARYGAQGSWILDGICALYACLCAFFLMYLRAANAVLSVLLLSLGTFAQVAGE